MKYCESCGARLEDDEITCPQCGKDTVPTKFCRHCGEKIDAKCIICIKCGKQVADADTAQAQNTPIVINNANTNTNTSVNINRNQPIPGGYLGKPVNKWTSLALCCFLGLLGAHKFYEGRIGMGILYLCTGGLCGFGCIFDIFSILMKPNPYYVYK